MTEKGYSSTVTTWLDAPEIKAGTTAIGNLVIMAAGCCTALSKRKSEQSHDMIAMIMAKVEQGKKLISDITLSSVPEQEKQAACEHIVLKAQEYFIDVMAQDV